MLTSLVNGLLQRKNRVYILFAIATASALLLGASAALAPVTAAEVACQPYSVVNKASVKACPAGYQGVQYTMTSKVCPSGVVTVSKDYVTKDCVPLSSGGSNGGRATINCSTNADTSCQGEPNAAGCPANMRWSLLGTGVAHCVLISANCGSGTMEIRDAQDNPSCIACTQSATSSTAACPAGYNGNIVTTYSTDSCTNVTSTVGVVNSCVLACYDTASSTTTACPAGQYGSIVTHYSTNSCSGVKTTVSTSNGCASCTSSYSESKACDSGYYGNLTRLITNNTCTGTNSIGNWDAAGCTACASTSYDYAACPSGYTGNMTRATHSNACTGAVSQEGWSSASCSPCESSYTDYGSCPSGQTGNTTRSVTSNVCNGTTSYGGWSSASCGPCETTSTNYEACPSGQSGNKTQTVTTNVCTNTTSYGAWSSAGCSPCESSSTQYGNCPDGQTGNTSRILTTNACTGTTSTSSWSSAGCSPCTTTTRTPEACDSGTVGEKYRITTTDVCNGTSSVTWDKSECAAIQTQTCWPGSNWRTEECTGDFTGTQKVTDTTSCPWGIYGAPYTTQSIDTSGCVVKPPPPTITCVPVARIPYTAQCSTNRQGFPNQDFMSEGVTCPNGPYGAPVVQPRTTTSPCYRS